MHELDLFGTPVEPLQRRGRSSAGLGTSGERASQPVIQQEIQLKPKRTVHPLDWPTVDEDLDDDDPPPFPALPPREAVQQYLQEQAIPYVDADKVKSGLFSADRLQMFDFLVHREEVTWLMAACDGEPNHSLASDLRQWERILGPGFQAVAAKVNDEDPISFRTIDSDKVEIQ